MAFYLHYLLEAQLNTLMMQMAQEITVVADASKIGRRSLSVIGNVSGVDRLITNSRIASEAAARIRSAGVEVLIA